MIISKTHTLWGENSSQLVLQFELYMSYCTCSRNMQICKMKSVLKLKTGLTLDISWDMAHLKGPRNLKKTNMNAIKICNWHIQNIVSFLSFMILKICDFPSNTVWVFFSKNIDLIKTKLLYAYLHIFIDKCAKFQFSIFYSF